MDAAGNVVFDSYEDEDTMENHADRPEIIQAFETGSGSAARYSETLATRSIYAARLLDNGGMVLRVGNSVDSVYAMLFSGVGVVLLIFFLILVAGMFFISKTTDRNAVYDQSDGSWNIHWIMWRTTSCFRC